MFRASFLFADEFFSIDIGASSAALDGAMCLIFKVKATQYAEMIDHALELQVYIDPLMIHG